MADTANYAWTKPTVGGSNNTWGTILNTAFDDIDTDLKAVSDVADAATAAAAANLLIAAPTGFVGSFARSSAPSGWVKGNGGTIGNAASGADRADADTEALFLLLWAEFNNTALPILDSSGSASTRGASAAADYAANKRLPVLDLRGEFLRAWDDSRGIDSGRALGSAQSDVIKNHVHPLTMPQANNVDGPGTGVVGTSVLGTTGYTTGNNTGGSSVETRPRNVALLVCIKL